MERRKKTKRGKREEKEKKRRQRERDVREYKTLVETTNKLLADKDISSQTLSDSIDIINAGIKAEERMGNRQAANALKRIAEKLEARRKEIDKLEEIIERWVQTARNMTYQTDVNIIRGLRNKIKNIARREHKAGHVKLAKRLTGSASQLTRRINELTQGKQ